MARERQSDNQQTGSRRRMWIMLGVGVATVAISAAVIVFAAWNMARRGAEVAPGGNFPEYAHILGEPDALVTIVEYSDMQ